MNPALYLLLLPLAVAVYLLIRRLRRDAVPAGTGPLFALHLRVDEHLRSQHHDPSWWRSGPGEITASCDRCAGTAVLTLAKGSYAGGLAGPVCPGEPAQVLTAGVAGRDAPAAGGLSRQRSFYSSLLGCYGHTVIWADTGDGAWTGSCGLCGGQIILTLAGDGQASVSHVPPGLLRDEDLDGIAQCAGTLVAG